MASLFDKTPDMSYLRWALHRKYATVLYIQELQEDIDDEHANPYSIRIFI